MRSLLTAGLAASLVFAAGNATAGVTIKTTVKTYAVRGSTGAELLAQMDSKGPKHGFLTRAIAQTRYEVTWNITWARQNRGCRVDDVDAKLNITYTYPESAGKMTSSLSKRWAEFMRGVRKHEEHHGVIAKRMVREAAAAVAKVQVAKDPRCWAARSKVKKAVDAAYSKYEAQQVRFDEIEHGDGGNVGRLVERFLR